MGFKINNAFILNSKAHSVVSNTNNVNKKLLKIIEKELINRNLKIIFELFVLFQHNINSNINLKSYLLDRTKEDIINSFILSKIDINDDSFINSITKIISLFKLNNIQSEFTVDAFFYHKIIGSSSYYVLDSTSSSLIEKVCIEIEKDESLNLKKYSCNSKNENKWKKVLDSEDIYTGMSRNQVSFENYYYKIIQLISNNIDEIFLTDFDIKNLIYKEYKYNELLASGSNSIMATIDSKKYIKDCKHENLEINSKIKNRNELISLFK